MFARQATKPAMRSGPDKRRTKRHQTDTLSCDLGDVRDISETGMKVACPRRPPVKVGQSVAFTLNSMDMTLQVPGQVVRMQRKGLRAFDLGVRFAALKPSVAAALQSLALFGCVDFQAAARVKESRQRQEPPRPQPKPQERKPRPFRASAQLPDYYAILGIRRDASHEEIRRAFRDMARKYHPDVCSLPQSQQKFQEVTTAYQILSNSDSRLTYDERLAG